MGLGPLANHTQWVKTKSVSLEIGNNTGMFSFTTLIQHSVGSPSHIIQIKRRKKWHPNLKRGSKSVIITDDMILYIENPKDSTKKLLELINEFGKVAGYKIKIQKPVAFLHTNNELSERKCKKTIPFTIAVKHK